MQEDLEKMLVKVANTIRHLSMDAVQKANSGHPGMPMGCAELGAYLFGAVLRYNPANPHWMNRDRLILSAGHGSMWLYSCLHLAGYDLSIDDLRNFRQLNSKTPGHPESHETPGVETTTGPLGQGVANAVGTALGLKMLGAKFNSEQLSLLDGKVYVVAGDGCLMEGISSESCSFAGHLNLDNLVLLYDSNGISLDGPLEESYSEDTRGRFKAYGWEVHEVDGHSFSELAGVFSKLRHEQQKPALVIVRTTIGKGAPNKAGTHKVHGAPLGADEVAAAKEALGLQPEEFYVSKSVEKFFAERAEEGKQLEKVWLERFQAWHRAHPDLGAVFDAMQQQKLPENLEEQLVALALKPGMSGRDASQLVIESLAEMLPFLYGGSADLSSSDKTMMRKFPVVRRGVFGGRNIKYGVREFAMAAMSSGLFQTGMMVPFCGTFLTFSDYMRNAIRLAALSRWHVIYQFTHDSIFLGEDGPTHQPVEHLAALRAIPGLQVLRPGDSYEVKMAWIAALRYKGPSAMILSRQSLIDLPTTHVPYAEGVGRGAYLVHREKDKPDYTLLATGSELHLALEVAVELEKRGKHVRVISMPCWELFEKQPAAYRQQLLGGDLGKRVSIEAGVELGWHRYIGKEGIAICMESFGASAPASELARHFGFTVDAILERIL